MKYFILSIVLAVFIANNLNGQNISISNDTTYSAEASAILDLNTTDKGLLIPRVVLNDASTASPVTSPVEGLLVYNDGGTEDNGFWYWSGSEWLKFVDANSDGINTAKLTHGEMYLEDPATTVTVSLTTAGTYYGLTSAIEGLNSGSDYVDFENNGTADRLKIGSQGGGKYYVSLSTSFSGNSNNVITAAIFKNGVLQNNLYLKRTLGTTGDVGSASLSGIITLAANDYIDVRFSSDTDNKNIYIHVMNIHISRITP